MPVLIDHLRQYQGAYKELVDERATVLEQLKNDFSHLEAMVEQTVDMQALERHEYLVNPSFNSQLKVLSEEKNEILDEMEQCRKDVCRSVTCVS